MAIITLTTDFGTRDSFVGAMKGVVAGIAPDARVIDLTHDIAAGDVRAGAFALATAVPCFPAGSIHVAVVDPGVGSERQAIAVRTPQGFFVGPDNGVLSWALRASKGIEVRRLTNPDWWRRPVSRTFHGRDIFAPVAAHLAAGASFADAGDSLDDIVRLPWPALTAKAGSCAGEVLHVDHFGNAITNIPADAVPPGAIERDTVRFHLTGAQTVPLGDCYAAVAPGAALAVPGSSGFIEIAINGGDAARTLGLAPGVPVVAVW
jgi:S-adenosylmethionine hydrolase